MRKANTDNEKKPPDELHLLFEESQKAAFIMLDHIFELDKNIIKGKHMKLLLGAMSILFDFIAEMEKETDNVFHDLIASMYYLLFKLTLENPKHV